MVTSLFDAFWSLISMKLGKAVLFGVVIFGINGDPSLFLVALTTVEFFLGRSVTYSGKL
jgi:hypothetical protein